MAQRLSEQVVEWLTVGGDAFTPQNFNSTNGNIPLVISKPGESVTIPATNGTAIGVYNNKGQLWTVGAAGATTSVKSSQLIVSSSDAAAGAGAALELWRGTDVSWQLLASNSDDLLYIGNNWTTAAQTSYTANVAFGYGAVANQYVHIYSTLDSNYAYGGASGSALSVAGGATFAKKVYINDTTDSNYSTVAGSFVTKGGAYIAKKTYIADATDSNYATLAGALVVAGGANIGKKVYIKDTTDSNYSTVAGSLVTMGGAYIKKKTYIADTTDASSTSTGSFSTAGGASVAKKLYVGSDFYQTGDTAQIASNNIVFRNKSVNNSQAGSYPYITGLTIGDGSEITLDEYKDGYLSIHSKSGLLIYPTNNARPAVYDTTKTYSTGTIVWYGSQYYRCTTAITTAEEWTAGHWTALPVAAGAMWVHGNINPTITNTYTLGTASYRWSKLYIGTADSYGSSTQPIYWSSGVPTASTSTVGSGVKPIYLSSGTLTVSSSSLGGTAKPIYMTSGELKAISDTVGTATKPVYLSSGTITVGTYELKATVNYEVNAKINSGTANQVAYYSGANAISSKAPAWSAWTAGTTAGPKANIQIGNATYTSDAIPSASASASGVVTNGTQTFGGAKTFDTAVTITAAGAANTALLDILTTRTPTVGQFDWGVKHLVANMIANSNTSGIVTGKAASAGNSAYFGFHYEASDSASNYVSIGMYGYNHLLTVNKQGVVTAGGFARPNGTASTHVISPSGGSYTTRTSTVTGAIKITLPVSWTNTMMTFVVEIFDYSNNSRNTYYISGYNYSTTPAWANCNAYSIGSGNKQNLKVRWGHDGTKCCVTIGETNTSWSYPQVTIRDFYGGYSSPTNTQDWSSGWSISFVTTLPSTVNITLPAYGGSQIYAGNNVATIESQIGVIHNAGKLYLYSTNTNTGGRGIYTFNNAGTGAYVFSLNQNNFIDQLATIAVDINLRGPDTSNQRRLYSYKNDGTAWGFFGPSMNGSHWGVYYSPSSTYAIDINTSNNITFNGHDLNLKGSCTASVAIDSAGPYVEFANANRDQYCRLVYSDYDSWQAPDSLTLIGNQANTTLVVPRLRINRSGDGFGWGSSAPSNTGAKAGMIYFKTV